MVRGWLRTGLVREGASNEQAMAAIEFGIKKFGGLRNFANAMGYPSA